MKKIILVNFLILAISGMIFAQSKGGYQQMSTADRAKMTIDKLSETIKFTPAQQTNLTTIFTKFYDDAKAQQAFRDPAKLAPLEKERDTKVEKSLNDKKLYKQYQDEMAKLKAEMQKRMEQHPQGQPQPH
jgi:hypothetical protein